MLYQCLEVILPLLFDAKWLTACIYAGNEYGKEPVSHISQLAAHNFKMITLLFLRYMLRQHHLVISYPDANSYIYPRRVA